MDEITKTQIVEELTELSIDLAPDAILRSMYGGIVIELIADVAKSRVGGFYVYAGHVSFEFANGTSFRDPHGLLEGSGKFRRHVKLHDLEDVRAKDCRGFLLQALEVYS